MRKREKKMLLVVHPKKRKRQQDLNLNLKRLHRNEKQLVQQEHLMCLKKKEKPKKEENKN